MLTDKFVVTPPLAAGTLAMGFAKGSSAALPLVAVERNTNGIDPMYNRHALSLAFADDGYTSGLWMLAKVKGLCAH